MCIFVDKLLIMKDFVFYIKLEHYLGYTALSAEAATGQVTRNAVR